MRVRVRVRVRVRASQLMRLLHTADETPSRSQMPRMHACTCMQCMSALQMRRSAAPHLHRLRLIPNRHLFAREAQLDGRNWRAASIVSGAGIHVGLKEADRHLCACMKTCMRAYLVCMHNSLPK